MDFIQLLKQNFNISLNDQQISAVLHKDGPAIILAVPGAGKTTTLICRTANLIINHGIRPNDILSITFSKASANDMKHRFTKMFGDVTSENIHFSTIHSFAFTILRHYCNSKQSNLPVLIEGEDSPISKASLLKSIYFEVNQEYISEDRLEELSNVIGYIKNMLIDVKTMKDDEFDIANLKEIITKYENVKRQKQYMDYDDLLVYAFKILKQSKLILNDIRNRYRYIQVDEGQDTSKIQHEIIKMIAAPNNNLFMVADDDQSIYGFRGAYPKFLLEFKQFYSTANVYYMEENYRSTMNIVSTANEFIKRNTQRYAKNLFANNEAGNKVNILSFNNEKDQFNHIINEIKKHRKLSDIAVLFRNNVSSIPLIDILDRNNISFYTRDKKMNFFNHWITQDIMAFIQLGLDDKDINSFEKVYYKMNLYISKDMLNYVKSNRDAYKKPVFDILLSSSQINQSQKENILRVKHFIRQIPKKDPLKAIQIIEQHISYKEYLQQSSKKNGCSVETANNILSTLKSIAASLEKAKDLINRIKEIKTIIEAATKNRGKDVVTLSTIHSAKGLEFEEIYMIDLIDGLFPTYNSIDSYEKGKKEGLEEERRLFYVGITRGKRDVTLISINSKNGEKVITSRFVREVDIIVNGKKETANKSKIKKGDRIVHNHFGKGKVVKINKDMMEVVFNDNQRKTLSIDLCINSNLLSLVNDKTGETIPF